MSFPVGGLLLCQCLKYFTEYLSRNRKTSFYHNDSEPRWRIEIETFENRHALLTFSHLTGSYYFFSAGKMFIIHGDIPTDDSSPLPSALSTSAGSSHSRRFPCAAALLQLRGGTACGPSRLPEGMRSRRRLGSLCGGLASNMENLRG